MPDTKQRPKKKTPTGHLAPGHVRRIRGIRSHIGDLKLLGEDFTSIVKNPTKADVSRTIEGASTLTIGLHDEDQGLLRSPLLKSKIDLVVDGLAFRLASIEKNGNQYDWVFEDREVALMRLVTDPRKVYRDQMTRAEFVYSQFQEAWLVPGGYEFPVYIPKLRLKRPVATADQAKQLQVKIEDGTNKASKGLDFSADLTVKGAAAKPEQMKLGETVLTVADDHEAPEGAMIALILACIVESEIQNLTFGTGSSTGILQVLVSTAANFHLDPRDPVACSVVFLEKGFTTGTDGAIELANRGMDPAQIAATVQGNAAGTASYSPYVDEARRWVAAFQGGGISGLSANVNFDVDKRYAFERKKGEDVWDSTGRLGEEVKFRRFVSAGVAYYVAETELLSAKPLMYLGGDLPDGIDKVDFTWDVGRDVQEVTVTGRVAEWGANPGCVVKLNEDYGPAEGLYVVSTIDGSLFSEDFTATLKKPMHPLAEPAPETVSKSVTVGETTGLTSKSKPVERMIYEADRIDKLHLTYVYGGGHVTPAPKDGPFDCSSAVSRLLQFAGYDIPTSVSGTLAGMFEPGKGKDCTIYANPQHTFIKLQDRFWGTSAENPGGGPGWFGDRGAAYLAGFSARHPKGT